MVNHISGIMLVLNNQHNSFNMTSLVNKLNINIIGPVTDVAWNETYHMIALSGFGDEHPIVVYTWERFYNFYIFYRNDQMNLMEYKDL
jgi:hypothetical protein